jgi:ubiquinone/menaquinone biosynthesis C-methylase UbiE
VELDEAKQRTLDDVLAAFADELKCDPAEENAAVTLAYTHGVQQAYRMVLRMLPITPGWSVLDVGSGLGILSFELAANLAVTVHGVDINARFVAHAQELYQRLHDKGYFAEGAAVRFSEGDIHALRVPDNSVDLVFVRELLQFLPDPLAAVSELFRVVRPGGCACLSDIDDALYITWPPPSPAKDRLVGAFRTAHDEAGGDRHIGRKLSTYLRQAGFNINSMVVCPEAQHRVVDEHDVERSLILAQLRVARDRLISSHRLTAAEFDADLAELASEPAHEEFRMNGRIVVLAQKTRRP